MMLVMIPDFAAKREQQEQRDLVSVVYLGDRIDHRHETRCAHDCGRSERTHVGAGAKPDCRFFPIDPDVDKPLVAIKGADQAHQPIVRQGCNELHAAVRELIRNLLCHFRRASAHRQCLCCKERALFAERKTRHTFSGLIGSVMSRTPRCHSASITALPIAAGAPTAPLSLAPFTPSGLLGAGVAMKSRSARVS